MPATMHANSRAAGMCAVCKSANKPRLKTPKTPHCVAAGKPAQGTLTISACHESGSILIGIHDDGRMAADYALVKEFIGLDKEFDVKTTYTNEFLDRSVKMTK